MKYLIALLTSVITGTAYASITVHTQLPRDEVERAMGIACAVLDTEVACPKRTPVALSAEMNDKTWGYYIHGTDIVWINSVLWNPQWGTFGLAVLAHELAHYMVDSDPLQAELTACENEAMAWRVFNSVVIAAGRYDLYDDTWRERYRCQ